MIGAGMLSGLRVAVDVQHLYRRSHAGDRGAVFTLENGTHVTEAHAATQYAAQLTHDLRIAGAAVLTNDAARGVLVGEYWTRNREAASWGAHAYLACHVNAGGGRYASVRRMRSSDDLSGGMYLAAGIQSGPPLAGIVGRSSGVLLRGERGAVCIQAFNGPALILEPFFGDTTSHQWMLGTDGLRTVGSHIAAGVGAWWAGRQARGQRG